jgi:MarR family transcriptional regulator, organic hydroperoxide resistance regulator
MPVKLKFNNPSLNAWMLFRLTYYSIVKCEDELFAGIGLTSQQFAVLMAIKQAPEPVTLTDVASWLDRDTASITSIIDNMSKKRLVERVRDLKDRRAVRLVITTRGEEVLRQAREPTVKQLMEIMSCLSVKEIQTLTRLLDKIRDKTFEFRNIKGKVKEITPTVANEKEYPWPVSKQ